MSGTSTTDFVIFDNDDKQEVINENKQEENEQDDEQEDEEVSIVIPDEISDINRIDSNDNYELYKVDLRRFVSTIDDWDYNRKKNPKHITELKQNYPNIIGDFIVVRCKYDNNKLLLIDGQHRRDAIIELFQTDPTLNGKGYVKVFNVDTKNDIAMLFKKINNVMPVKINEIPQFVYVEVIDQLQSKFPKAIKSLDRTTFPYMKKNELLKQLQDARIVEEFELISTQLYDAIFKKNSEYSVKKDIFRNIKTPGAYEKAQTSGFYLGLDRNGKWISELRLDLKESKQESLNEQPSTMKIKINKNKTNKK